MEWTQESTIELIDAYKKREVIWDSKHPFHFHKIRRQDAWEEISVEVKRPAEDCKKKMEGLLSSFRRENMKIRKSIGAGKGKDEVYKSCWYAFESLKFLLDKNKPRQPLNNVQKKETVKDEETTDKSGTQEEDTPNISNVSLFMAKSTPPRKRKHSEDRRLDTDFQILSSCGSQSSNVDESQDFGNMVAKKLRKYNDLTQCIIQNEILGIFLNAERGFYEHLASPNPLLPNYPSPNLYPNIDVQRQFQFSQVFPMHTRNIYSPQPNSPSNSSISHHSASSTSEISPKVAPSPVLTTSSEVDINLQDEIK